MNYDEYRGKLLDLKTSVEELKRIQNENCQKYRTFIDKMSGLPSNKRTEQLEIFNNHSINLSRHYDVQISFIEELIDRLRYNEIFTDVLTELEKSGVIKQESKVLNKDNTNTRVNSSMSSDFHPKYNSSNMNMQESVAQKTNGSILKDNHEKQNTNQNKMNNPYEKYINEFLDRYSSEPADYLLDVYDDFARELSNYTLATWNNYSQKDNISLTQALGNAKYYAYKLPNQDRYYFAVPARSVRFSEMQIITGAFLTFFDLPLDDIVNSCGVMPKLVRPAVLEKREDGLYYVKEKGKYQY